VQPIQLHLFLFVRTINMKLIANRQLCGDYGVVSPDQEFDASDDVAKQLLDRGLVRAAQPPTVTYETKPIVPQEQPQLVPESPFRHVPMPDTESSPVATESDTELSVAGLPEERASDHSGRRRRS
jgi:hypothetical protein